MINSIPTAGSRKKPAMLTRFDHEGQSPEEINDFTSLQVRSTANNYLKSR